MASELKHDSPSAIAHILLIDVVGYSKLLVNAQTELLQYLNHLVRGCATYRSAEASGNLTKLPTGDGMALLFFDGVESPLRCALEVGRALREQPSMELRMGIHSGPIKQVSDVNERENFAGAGINVAQRVLDCGDAGHILVSQRVAEDLMPYEEWHDAFQELGECEVKHGLRLHLFNVCKDGLGNPELPTKLKQQRRFSFRGRSLWRRLLPTSSRRAVAVVSLAVVALIAATLVYLFATTTTRAKSIAVGPFENRSSDPQDRFLADSVADEIREQLRRLPALTVIRSRTAPGEAIRKESGYLLGGSVQHLGDDILIRVWLVDPLNDVEKWSHSERENFANIYTAQQRIAQETARELRSLLGVRGELPTEAPPTRDPLAYRRYLEAKSLIDLAVLSSHARDDLLAAIKLLNDAISRDPRFFLAFYQRAHAQDQLYFRFEHTPQQLQKADEAVQTLQLANPDAGETHLAAAKHFYWCYSNYDAARRELAAAEKSLPDDPYRILLTAYIDRREGKWEAAENNFERARKMDPQNPVILQQIAVTEFTLRHYAGAANALDLALELLPNDFSLRVGRAGIDLEARADTQPLEEVYASERRSNPAEVAKAADNFLYLKLCEHDAAGARAALESLGRDGCRAEPLLIPRAWCEGLVAQLEGKQADATDAFQRAAAEAEQQLSQPGADAFALCVLGLMHAGLGLKEQAMDESRRAEEMLPRARDAMDGMLISETRAVVLSLVGEKDLALDQIAAVTAEPGGLAYGNLKLHPYWDPLRGDPRFQQILDKLKPVEP